MLIAGLLLLKMSLDVLAALTLTLAAAGIWWLEQGHTLASMLVRTLIEQ